MKIGQICLAPRSSGGGERFASLVEALASIGVKQHVLVTSAALARRLAACPNVTVGPVVKTPVMAYCLMPDVDLAHVHELKSGQAGLLLTLTRSIPYVITTENEEAGSRNPLTRSVFHRAAQVIPLAKDAPISETANDHLSVYRDTIDARVRTALML